MCKVCYFTIIVKSLFLLNFVICQDSKEYRLFQRLFKNYNKNVRPTKTPEKPIIVSVGFFLGKIDTLNEKDQYLKSYGWLGVSWNDDFLEWNATEEGVNSLVVPYDMIWLPEICLKNSITEDNDLSLKLKYRVRVQSSGHVAYVPGSNLLTSCKIQLTYFPFDIQVCHLEFVKWLMQREIVEYQNQSEKINLGLFVENHEWDVLETKSGVRFVKVGESRGLDMVYATIALKRKPLYYTMTLTFPLCLTTILTFYMFLLPCESGEKVSLGISVLLSYSVLLLLISDILPRNSETAPILMIIVLMNMTFTALCLLLTVFVINIYHHSPEKKLPKWAKSILFDYLAVILFCKLCSTHKKVGDKGEEELNWAEKKTNTEVHEFYSTVNLPNDLKEFLKKKINDDKEQEIIEGNKKEWNKAARILDRFFAFIMSLTLIIYLSYILNHLSTAGKKYNMEFNLSK